MTTVGGLFYKFASTNTKVLCEKLRPLVDETTSPKEVKCTKRLYLCITKHLDTAVANSWYDCISILFKALSYVANSSKGPSGFHKFITFGLPEKYIQSWLDKLFSQAHGELWGDMVDTVLFNLTVVFGLLAEEDQQELVSLLTPLLNCVYCPSLPCSAKIEAARGSNILLEACSVDYKTTFTKKPETKQIILSMGKAIPSAGNFELQVSIVECLYRLTSATERGSLATKWFSNISSSTLQRFTLIREAEFEVDCRSFLNELNSSLAERTVHSLSCMRMFCGTNELQCPQDESHFWVDFNTVSKSVTIFVDDPSTTQDCEESVWEMITIKESSVVNWSVKVLGGEYVLAISLKDPAHSLLPSLPPSPSHEVTISFNSACDPTQPTSLVFGASKQLAVPTSSKSHVKHTKQSSAVRPIYINQRDPGKQKKLQEISPIEAPPDTPAQGEQISSQNSSVTPNNKTVAATPATSTPKPQQLKSRPQLSTNRAYVTPSSSGRRLPLMFVSSGTCVNAPKRSSKSSMAVNSVVLKKCGSTTVVRTGDLPASKEEQSVAALKADKRLEEKSRVPQNKKKLPEVTEITPAGRKNVNGKKCLSQLANFRVLECSEDVDSPVLDYGMPTAAVLKRLQSQEESLSSVFSKRRGRDSDTDSIDSDPYKLPEDDPKCKSDSVLSDMTNKSFETLKQRKFNLSGISAAHAKKSKSQSKKSSSRNTSLNSSTMSGEIEPLAIPDSLPADLCKEKSPSPKTTTKGKRKPAKLSLSRKSSSDHTENENELDISWEPAKELSKLDKLSKDHSSKPTSARSSTRQRASKRGSKSLVTTPEESSEVDKHHPIRPVPARSTRQQANKKGSGGATKSLAAAPAPKSFKSQSERQQFISEVYDDFTTPDVDATELLSKKNRKRVNSKVPNAESPKAKVTKLASKAPQSKKVPAGKVSKPPPKVKSRKRQALSPSSRTRQTKLKPTSSKNAQKPFGVSNKYSSPLKTYGTKRSRQIPPVTNHDTDFDDLLFQTKRHCPEKNRYQSEIVSPSLVCQSIENEELSCNSVQQFIQEDCSPSSNSVTRSPIVVQQLEGLSAGIDQQSLGVTALYPVTRQQDVSLVSQASDSCSGTPSVKDKVMDTEQTEKASVPPNVLDEANNLQSPSSSTHITADLDVTAGFQQICRTLISKSGISLGCNPQKVPRPNQIPRTPECEAACESEEESVVSDATVSCKMTLSQLTRDIINSHKVATSKVGAKVARGDQTEPSKPKTKVLPAKVPPPLTKESTFKSKQSSNIDDGMESDMEDMLSDVKSSLSCQDTLSSSPRGRTCEPFNRNIEMCDLANLFGNKSSRSKKVKQKRSAKNLEMLQLWSEHHDQRKEVLSVYHDQLYKELETLEKDVQHMCTTERQTMKLMKSRMKTLEQSIGSQQKQVDRIRTLQVTFHQHFGQLEENQTSEQMNVQRSLKQEMHSLQKKLLVDYERKEVSRIKQSLHAMLLQVS